MEILGQVYIIILLENYTASCGMQCPEGENIFTLAYVSTADPQIKSINLIHKSDIRKNDKT